MQQSVTKWANDKTVIGIEKESEVPAPTKVEALEYQVAECMTLTCRL